MPADGFVMCVRNGQFSEHLLITHEHALKIHHFTETDDALPFHRLCNFLWTDMRAGSLKPGSRGNAGRHLHPDMDGLLLRLVHYQLDTFESKDVCHLMRVNEHACRASHSNRTDKLSNGHHARFNVHVSIEQAGHEIASLRINDFRLFTNRVTRIFSDVGDVPVLDGNIRTGDDLTRLDRHPFAIEDHQVGRDASHGGIYERTGEFCG